MNQPLQSANGETISYEQMLGQQAATHSTTPKEFNAELLIKRVKAGGDSGVYLAEAFISAYSMEDFNGSLGNSVYLDAEGLGLLVEIIYIRKIKGWSDSEYHAICCEIKDIIGDKA